MPKYRAAARMLFAASARSSSGTYQNWSRSAIASRVSSASTSGSSRCEGNANALSGSARRSRGSSFPLSLTSYGAASGCHVVLIIMSTPVRSSGPVEDVEDGASGRECLKPSDALLRRRVRGEHLRHAAAAERQRVDLRQRRRGGRHVHRDPVRARIELPERARQRERTPADLRAYRVRLELSLPADRE